MAHHSRQKYGGIFPDSRPLLKFKIKDTGYGPTYDVDARLIQRYGNQLGTKWTFVDPEGNQHELRFHRFGKSGFLYKGMHELRAFYSLIGVHHILLKFMGNNMFGMRIKDCNRRNVKYPITLSDSDNETDKVEHGFTILSEYQATRSQINLPKEIGNVVRSSGAEFWKLKGPSEEEVECKILRNAKYITKLGTGWKWFCMINQLKAGDKCTFKIQEGQAHTLDVSVQRC